MEVEEEQEEIVAPNLKTVKLKVIDKPITPVKTIKNPKRRRKGKAKDQHLRKRRRSRPR